MIGFGNMAEPDFASSPSGNVAEKYPPAGGMGGLGFTPVSAFVIQMLCLQLRRLWRQGLCGAGNCAAYGGRGYVVLGPPYLRY